MFERILVPVDGSKYSTAAIRTAIELAQCHGSHLYLLHVIRDLSLPREILQMISKGEVTESRKEILEDSAEIILDSAKEDLQKAGLADFTAEFVMGDPATKMLEYAEKQDVGLIVIGHRGLGLGGGLLGSVARKLVNMTNVSVLIAT
jgi:nucleotide-binding universal stress UspA family protein